MGDVMDELNASGELWPEPKTEDGAVTPPAAPATTPAPTGGELAAESATGVGAPEAAPSSQTTRQEAGLEGNGGDRDEARLELVAEGNQIEGQQVLGTCLPGTVTRLVDALVDLAIRFQEWREPRVLSPEELHRQRIAEQERARTQWLINNSSSEVEQ